MRHVRGDWRSQGIDLQPYTPPACTLGTPYRPCRRRPWCSDACSRGGFCDTTSRSSPIECRKRERMMPMTMTKRKKTTWMTSLRRMPALH